MSRRRRIRRALAIWDVTRLWVPVAARALRPFAVGVVRAYARAGRGEV